MSDSGGKKPDGSDHASTPIHLVGTMVKMIMNGDVSLCTKGMLLVFFCTFILLIKTTENTVEVILSMLGCFVIVYGCCWLEQKFPNFCKTPIEQGVDVGMGRSRRAR